MVAAMGRCPAAAAAAAAAAAWALPSLPLLLLLLLLALPGTRNSSVPEKETIALTLFFTDDPSLPEGILELKTHDRSIAYYDTTLSSAQFHLAGLEQFRILVDEFVEKNKDNTIALGQSLLHQVMALTNNSLPPNEIGKLFLYSEKPVVFGETNTLICFITGFFPPAIVVTLQKNEKPLSGEVNSSRLSFGDDWRFQMFQYAHVQPAVGDIYSCKVVHNISKEEKIIYWEPEEQDRSEDMTELHTSQLAVLICGLIVGILGTAVGLCLCFCLRVPGWGSWIIRISPSVRVLDSS
ncbi:RLA class II histocompatibility antigen, DP alpha-1 chain-like [Pristis pectinata]|uniref:RLA class II histocompatibility antigen, DP alpha-1 chain-like n=1 Tax=Pristis pectinata TaxID=685728 RepID=UPI00223C9B3B|nr:RLA class II histocompatibility antigen, DP alpha-1 chain-like [Pristis pectinata]